MTAIQRWEGVRLGTACATRLLPLLVFLLLPVAGQAQYTYTTANGKITITKYTGPGGAVAIPTTINGLPVTGIGGTAFFGCNLSSVTFPASLTSIGYAAFYGCNLSSLTFPSSLTNIGNSAFGACYNLSSVTIPNNVTSIGNEAFTYCTYLTSVTIGDGVTSIGCSAFNDCIRLTNLTIGNSVTSIGNGAFNYCTSLASVTIPNSVTSIGSSAFNNCTSLSGMTIGNSVTNIGSSAFNYCIRLTGVTLPSSVTSVGDDAFYGCTGLTTIAVDAQNPAYSSVAGVLFNKTQTTLVQYPAGKTGSYTIPDSVTSIGFRAFYFCTSLTSVTIPNSVARIEVAAFYYCTNLISATIGNSVTNIGNGAFGACTRLTGVTLPNSVTSIGSSAFSGCIGLTSVTIPSSVTSIGDYAFASCTNLTGITIGTGVTSIGNYAFSRCSKLTSVTIPSSVTSFGSMAFYGCTSLTSITADAQNAAYSSTVGVLFNKTRTTLIEWPAGKVGSYTIPDGVTSIGDYAFCSCASLTSVTLPAGVTSIGIGAFLSCTSLTGVTIPNSVTSIDSVAFYGCTSLKGVYFRGNAPSVGSDVLYNDSDTTVYRLSGATGWPVVPAVWCGRPTALWNPVYLLAVNEGTGGGSYTNQQPVTITATAPAVGKTFDRWTGATQGVANVTASTTTLTMPAQDVTLTATYKDVYYTLTVAGGSGGGSYVNQQPVTITANAPPLGKTFDRWTGEAQGVASVTASTTTLTMPAQPITVTATYKDAYYTLTVTGGSGGGAYTNQQPVAIAAAAPAVGKTFDRWTGETQYVAGVTSPATTVTMPAQAVSLTATYKDVYYALTVNGGSGSGAYTNQQPAGIAADAPAVGKTFDRWIGATPYVANVTASATTVTMPAQDVSLTATYKDAYYTLTVNGGSGSGAYTNQQPVGIAAAAPAVGKTFDQWTGATQCVASLTASATTVTMPAQAVSLTATYKDAYYALTVNGGSGGGSYTNRQPVTIAAAAPAVGKTFDQWTGETQWVASVTSSATTVTMPAHAVSLTATYKDAYYTLTVNGGSGGGSYTNQQQVTITANEPPTGKNFGRWDGATPSVASVTASVTTVTMPAQDVSLTATYKDAYYTLTVNGGSGGGSYTNQQPVTITAAAPTLGKTFDRWTGETQCVASVTSSPTTVTMPVQAVSLTATYKDAYYALTVNGGSGGGSYTNQQQVPIAANEPPVGKSFDQWTGATQYVASVTSSVTTVTMPAQDVVLTAAMDKDVYYALTVNGGSGGGAYTNQQQVMIMATALPVGKAFDRWTGATQYVASVTSSTTTVTMPAQPVTLAATYKDAYYTLTVISGRGGGAYTNQQQVTITADTAADGKSFDGWTGATQVLASVTSSTTTVTMPVQSVILRATYKDVYFALTVTGGSGSGSYTNQQSVTITANAPAIGKTFDRWLGATQVLASVTASTTTVTMPAQVVALTVSNKDVYCALTVNGGSGSGSYTYQQPITITASTPPLGKTFDRWTGDTPYVASVTASNTTVTMPAQEISLTATHKDAYYALTVTDGSGGGSYTNRQQVTIMQTAQTPEKTFDRWTGDTQYVTSVTSPITTVTIPAQDICVTATYSASGYFTYTTNNGTLTITKYTGPGTKYTSSGWEMTIPGTINGLLVTRIGSNAFDSCTSLTTLTIPSSVTNIGEAAFYRCCNLTSVTISSNVTSIGIGAFAFCPRTPITVDEHNPVYSSLDRVLFNKTQTTLIQCPADEVASDYNYTIPSGVTSIGDKAFYNCDSLASVAIPGSVTNIGNWAFYDCWNLRSVYCQGSAPTRVGTNVFSDGYPTTVYYLPRTTGWDTKFAGCNTALLPDVPSVPYVCTTNNGTVAITGYAGSVGAVTLPETINGLPVTSIAAGAFYYCASLTSITIPGNVTNIGDRAFYNCWNLMGIYFQGNAPGFGSDVFAGDDSAIVYYPLGTTGWDTEIAGRTTALWPYSPPVPYTYTTNNGAITITAYTGSVGVVTIPSMINGLPVTGIGAQTFSACANLTSVTIPDSVTNIVDGAFYYRTSLTAITVDAHNSVYSSVDGALFNKTQTTLIECPAGKAGSYTIPNSVTNIGSMAFHSCRSLTSITIPTSVTSIGSMAFYGCSALTAIYFKGNAPSGGLGVLFDGTTNPTVYYLPGTAGWGPTFGNRTTALWNPEVQRDPNFGVRTNKFGFTIAGTSNLVIVVEACTNLVNPAWSPLGTNTLTGGSCRFDDPQWTNYPVRFYRIHSP